MRPLGKRQWSLLKGLASPGMFLILGDKVSDSLVRRGLLVSRAADGDGLLQITPAGMRMVADAWEAGEIDYPPPEPRKLEAA